MTKKKRSDEPTVAERADGALIAIRAWEKDKSGKKPPSSWAPDECDIQDLISDLLHLCVRLNVDKEIVGRAIRNFEVETKSETWGRWASEAGGRLRDL